MESGLITLRFYVAGDGFFTRQARANLDRLIAELGESIPIEKEITDVTDDPAMALQKGILTTPTLVAILDSKQFRFVGDLSQRDGIIRMLKTSLD